MEENSLEKNSLKEKNSLEENSLEENAQLNLEENKLLKTLGFTIATAFFQGKYGLEEKQIDEKFLHEENKEFEEYCNEIYNMFSVTKNKNKYEKIKIILHFIINKEKITTDDMTILKFFSKISEILLKYDIISEYKGTEILTWSLEDSIIDKKIESMNLEKTYNETYNMNIVSIKYEEFKKIIYEIYDIPKIIKENTSPFDFIINNDMEKYKI